MAEALGVVSGIIAVADLTYTVLGYLKSVHDAGKDIQDYNREAPHLAELLTSLAVHVTQSGGQNGDPWFEAVETLQCGPMQQYQIAVEKLKAKIAPGTGRREKLVQRITWKFVKDEVKDNLAKMERLKSLIVIALQKDHFKLSKEIHSISSRIKDDTAVIRAIGEHHTTELASLKGEASNQSALSLAILQDTSQIEAIRAEASSTEETKHKARLLEWLSHYDYTNEQHDNISQYKDGTGMWLLEDAKFKEWKDGAHDTLFCVGMPGAGKTVMSAMVIRHLFEMSRISTERVAVAFMYFRYGLRESQSSKVLIGSLIRQLVNQVVKAPDLIEKAFEHRSNLKHRKPSPQEMLQAAVGCFSSVFFVIDGLDEGAVFQVRGLISAIRYLQKPYIKLLATSRFIPEIQEQFKKALSIEIRGSDTDIQSYATGRISELPRCAQTTPTLQTEIVDAIVMSTEGMFLLAKLHIDSLKDKRTVKAMRSMLKILPTGSSAYDTAYAWAMKRISDQTESDYTLAQEVLTWIVYAMEPLSEKGLETALAVELGGKYLDPDNVVTSAELISLCAGLVTLDEESKTVRLVHYTTQEYFSRNPQHLLRNPHRILSDTCVSYLGMDDFMAAGYVDDETEKQFLSHTNRYPFLTYAAAHWEDHSRAALPFTDDEEAAQTSFLELRLLRHQELMESYFRARWGLIRGPSHIPAVTGTYRPLGRNTGMQYAAARGYLEHVSRLLESGLDPNDSTYGTTPLFEAARGRHDAVVRVLLEAKANVNFQVKESGHTSLTAAIDVALMWSNPVYLRSSKEGYHPSRTDPGPTVALLLAAGADPEHVSGNLDNLTPLMRASESGMETAVSMLCGAGADGDRRGGNDRWGTGGRTALHFAACRGRERIVKQLVQYGCDPDIADNLKKTPALCAAEDEHWTVVEILLHTSIIDLGREMACGEKTTDMGSILELAFRSKECPDALVERLIETCSKRVKASSRPLLLRAAVSHRKAAVKSLLDVGADPYLIDHNGHTALHAIARLEHNRHQQVSIVITRALLGAKMGVDTRNRDGATALMLASRTGHSALVGFLLENGANVLLKDNGGQSPLAHAAWNGHPGIVTSLLHAGASPENDNSFVLAASNGHVDILRILIGVGADVNRTAGNETTALTSAVSSGQLDAARMLIEAGAMVNARMADGTSPIFLSATMAERDLTRLLLDNGANANLENNRGETPLLGVVKTQLKWAGNTKHIQDVVTMLLEAGADVNALAKMLLEGGGADVNALADDSDTALGLMTGPGDPCSDHDRPLLAAGADALAHQNTKSTALVPLALIDKMDILVLESLLKAGADPNEHDDYGMTALMWVSSGWNGSQVDKLKVLLGYGATPDSINSNGETALLLALGDGSGSLCIETLRVLLDAGANPNHKDATGRNAFFYLALRRCCYGASKCEEAFKALVDARGDISATAKDHDTLLLWSARLGACRLLKLLITAGTDPQGSDKDGRHAVMLASMTPDDDCGEALKILLDAGVDPNQRDCNGDNALMLAAKSSHSPMAVRTLLVAGMDPHCRDAKGLTLLMLVASKPPTSFVDDDNNVSEIISTLIEAGVDVNSLDKNGNTALMYAVENGGPVRTLLEAGANPNLASCSGQTALMKCLIGNKVAPKKTIRELVDAGADINAVDSTGRNVIIWSASSKDWLCQHVQVMKQILNFSGVVLDHTDNDAETVVEGAEHVRRIGCRRDQVMKMQMRENNGKTK